jgi:hypothetical protein
MSTQAIALEAGKLETQERIRAASRRSHSPRGRSRRRRRGIPAILAAR